MKKIYIYILIFFIIRTTPPHPITTYDCDFESSTCSGWTISSKPELTWTRVQGSVASQEDAHNPVYDHSTNQAQGYYLLLTPNKTITFPDVRNQFSSFFSFVLN